MQFGYLQGFGKAIVRNLRTTMQDRIFRNAVDNAIMFLVMVAIVRQFVDVCFLEPFHGYSSFGPATAHLGMQSKSIFGFMLIDHDLF